MLNWLRKTNDRIPPETERLSAYLDNALPAGERSRLERQLRHDATLRAELDELQRTVQMLRQIPAAPLPRTFTLDPAVYGQQVRPRPYVFPALRLAAVASTLLFVMLFAGEILLGGAGRYAATSGEIAMEPALMMVEQETVAVEQAPGALREAAPSALTMEETLADEAAEMNTAESAPADQAAKVVVTVEVSAEVEAPAEAPASRAVVEETAPAVSAEEAAMTAAPPGEGGMAAGSQPTPEATAEAEWIAPTATPAPAMDGAPPVADSTLASPTLAATLYAVPLQPEEPPSIDDLAATEEQLADGAALSQAADEAQAPAPAPRDTRTTDWLELAQVGAGLLAIGLLVLTVLARRLNW